MKITLEGTSGELNQITLEGTSDELNQFIWQVQDDEDDELKRKLGEVLVKAIKIEQVKT